MASVCTASVWAGSVRRSLDEAIEVLGAAVDECPDELWRTPMWRVQPGDIVGEIRDADDRLVTDPTRREALVQRWSAPWSVAWHALEVLDYDLAGEFDAWAPPAPFAGKPHWRTFTSLPDSWTPAQITEYVAYCRQRIRDTFAEMTDDRAGSALPSAHRYGGQPYAWLVTSLIGHTVAHATQIRQFVQAGSGPLP